MLTCPECAVTVQPTQRFCANCGTPLLPNRPLARPATTPDVAEHRQLTLIFSDIVGSTTLTSTLGAEKYRELLRSFREITARIVAQYGGHLSEFRGDGMLIHFGFPIAREDDPFRAVQACLDLQEAVGVLNERYRPEDSDEADFIQIRIGIHTGMVIAGDIESETTVEQMAIVGEAANIAARLQGLANPGSIIISQNTYDFVGSSFDCRYLGAPPLKGIEVPIKIFEVHAAEMSRGLRRGPARGPMIGRENEIAELEELWKRSLTGESTLVAVTGEAGVGKSRLLRPAEKFDRLRAALQLRFSDPREHITILSNVLSIPVPADYTASREYTPQQEKARLQEILSDWLIRESEIQPILLVVEDMHWADPSTIELLSSVLPKLTTARACSVMTFREEFDLSRIALKPRMILLRRLDREQTYDLIREIAIERSLSVEILETLSARTDGVPLFIEELTRLVVESEFTGAFGEAGTAHQKLPATLQQSLNARIDRAGANREILHLCATIGREFENEMIIAIWDGDGEVLSSELEKLKAAGILESFGIPQRRKWTFRHALIQEKIYESALSPHRRDAHARIAAAIQDKLPAICSDNPEILAHHFLEARMNL
jgi:class 3 adenylate cyclase